MTSRRIATIAAVLMAALLHAFAAHASCPPAPRPLCLLGGKNRLQIVDAASDDADRLTWKWSKGFAPSPNTFGDPTATTSMSLCLYDGTALVAALDLPAGSTCGGAACWAASSKGFTWYDATGTHDGVRSVKLGAGQQGSVSLTAKGASVPLPPLPAAGPLTVQLVRTDGSACVESIFASETLTRNDATQLRARVAVSSATPLPSLASSGCGTPLAGYAAGTSTVDSLDHDGIARTFRVFVPTGYDPDVPAPIVFLFHGGLGSGAQIETGSRFLPVAEAQRFIVVSPDGVAGPGGVRAWNGGGCCGYPQANAIDDVGFVAAVIDRLEEDLCVDRRRIYATGMSNGGIMSHRLACDLADRIRAVAPVAGAMMASPCAPVRNVPVLTIHGTADLNLPYTGGLGCGLAGVPFPSVAESIEGWRDRGACKPTDQTYLVQGDGTCIRKGKCPAGADLVQCDIPGGGHQWPGGEPSLIEGLPGCPFGYQSQTFRAPDAVWTFFSGHPAR